AHQPVDCGGRFLNLLKCLLVIACSSRIEHAVLEVVVEKSRRNPLNGPRERTNLGEDVDAVLLLIDHARDPPRLPFDAFHALQILRLVFDIAVMSVMFGRRHWCHLSWHAYCFVTLRKPFSRRLLPTTKT